MLKSGFLLLSCCSFRWRRREKKGGWNLLKTILTANQIGVLFRKQVLGFLLLKRVNGKRKEKRAHGQKGAKMTATNQNWKARTLYSEKYKDQFLPGELTRGGSTFQQGNLPSKQFHMVSNLVKNQPLYPKKSFRLLFKLQSIWRNKFNWLSPCKKSVARKEIQITPPFSGTNMCDAESSITSLYTI